MSLAELTGVVGLLVGLLSLVSVVYLAGVKIARIEVKVDTLWDFQMRRGASEAVKAGVASLNSPLEIHDAAKAWMRGLEDELRAFYARLGRRLSARDLAIEIERRYGDKILLEVCIPNGLTAGACLLIAMAVAKETTQEDEK